MFSCAAQILRHRGAHRFGIERLGPQALAHVFLRQTQVGLRGRDFHRFVAKLGAQQFGVGRRQACRDAIEAVGQTVVDPRDGRQRYRALE